MEQDGSKTRRLKRSPDELKAAEDMAVGLYSKGMPILDVSKQADLTSSQVYKALKAAGVPLRNYHEKLVQTIPPEEKASRALEAVAGAGMSATDLIKEITRLRRAKLIPKRHAPVPTSIRGVPKDDILKMWHEGSTLEEIAAVLGISRERVRQIIKSLGMASDEGGYAAKIRIQHQAIRDAYKSGMSLNDVVKATGFTANTVHNALGDLYNPHPERAPLRDPVALKALYESENRNASALAKRLGCTMSMVVRHLKAAGIPVKSFRATAAELRRTQLYDKVWLDEQLKARTEYDVARQFSISVATLQNVKRRLGLISTPPSMLSLTAHGEPYRRGSEYWAMMDSGKLSPTGQGYFTQYPLLYDKAWMEAQGGRSVRDIAKEIGCSQGLCVKRRHALGLASKPRGKFPKLRDRIWMEANASRPGAEVAKEIGCHGSAIYVARSRLGLNNPHKKYPMLHDRAWLEARAGKSGMEIAREIGCGHAAVYRARERFGLPAPTKAHSRTLALVLNDRAWLDARSNLSAEMVAKEAGCGVAAVYKARKRLGVQPKTTLLRNLAWMTDQLVRKGRSKADVATELGLSERHVSKVWKKMWKV